MKRLPEFISFSPDKSASLRESRRRTGSRPVCRHGAPAVCDIIDRTPNMKRAPSSRCKPPPYVLLPNCLQPNPSPSASQATAFKTCIRSFRTKSIKSSSQERSPSSPVTARSSITALTASATGKRVYG